MLATSAKTVATVEAAAGGAEAVIAAPAEVAKPVAEVAAPVGEASVISPLSSHSPRSLALSKHVSKRSHVPSSDSGLERMSSSLSFWRKLELLTCVSCLESYWRQCHYCGESWSSE